MKEYNLDKYFGTSDNSENAYYGPRSLIVILEGEMGKCFDDIKDFAKNASINITSEQIIEFLNKTFEQEKPELKARIDNREKVVSSGEILFGAEQIEHIKNSRSEFEDSINVSRYVFTPYSLEYFRKYASILKSKLFLLLNIIEDISNNKNALFFKELNDLDINLDSNGNILKEDIIRLILPTIYNLNALESIVNEGNNFETYLEFKLSEDNLYKRGISVGGLYPPSAIQVKNIYGNHDLGNVPLSENQKNELDKILSKRIEENSKFIVDLWD